MPKTSPRTREWAGRRPRPRAPGITQRQSPLRGVVEENILPSLIEAASSPRCGFPLESLVRAAGRITLLLCEARGGSPIAPGQRSGFARIPYRRSWRSLPSRMWGLPVRN